MYASLSKGSHADSTRLFESGMSNFNSTCNSNDNDDSIIDNGFVLILPLLLTFLVFPLLGGAASRVVSDSRNVKHSGLRELSVSSCTKSSLLFKGFRRFFITSTKTRQSQRMATRSSHHCSSSFVLLLLLLQLLSGTHQPFPYSSFAFASSEYISWT